MIGRSIPHAIAAVLLAAASSTVLLAGGSEAWATSKLKKPLVLPGDDAPKKPAAAAADPAPKKAAAGVPLLPGSGSKEPVNITADKLDFLNKENKLIYTGNVVVIQGDSTLKGSVLNIDLQRDQPGAGGATAPATPAPADATAPGQGSSVRHMEVDGPVTLISKDQVGTGNHATYDKAENKVYLNGNVTLSQGTNVTQGDRLVYDMTSGQAQVYSGQTNGGRVSSVFTPGSGGPPGAPAPAKPAAGPAKAAPSAKQGKTTSARRGEDSIAHDLDAEQ